MEWRERSHRQLIGELALLDYASNRDRIVLHIQMCIALYPIFFKWGNWHLYQPPKRFVSYRHSSFHLTDFMYDYGAWSTAFPEFDIATWETRPGTWKDIQQPQSCRNRNSDRKREESLSFPLCVFKLLGHWEQILWFLAWMTWLDMLDLSDFEPFFQPQKG